MSTTEATTCTIVVSGDGGRCGRPAVTSFTSARTGDVFAECEHHAVNVPAAPHGPIAAGDAVTITYNGKERAATVVSVRAIHCTVSVVLWDGRSKNIDRPIDEVHPR